VAIGSAAGLSNQGIAAIAIGNSVGVYNQDSNAIAIGNYTGRTSQGSGALALITGAGYEYQGENALAIGRQAGAGYQGQNAIALGQGSGNQNQGQSSIAIGQAAGYNFQSTAAIAIGFQAGSTNQGQTSIAIGFQAGLINQSTNTIVLNASGSALNTLSTNALYVKPIRNTTGTNLITYNTNTFEVGYSDKSFIIPHPVNKDKYLVHICLEGPEAGVYYRGKAVINDGDEFVEITLPNYVDALATDFTINITPIYDGKVKGIYSATEVVNGTFRIYGTPGKVHWTVWGKRHDIEAEPDVNTTTVQGAGPYKWI